jgi:tetratricopeptide (TPR) repeat protein
MLAVLLMLCARSASAGKPDNVSQAEMALIPEYCADANTFGYGDAYWNTSPNAPKWVGLMGKGFWAIHHYCWALINLGRVQRAGVPATVQQWTREAALGDLYYVIQNSQPNFIMLPEIYTKIGEVKVALKRINEAADAFASAWTIKPDYWPAYYHWAEYLRRTGQKQKAREVVEDGLSHAPDAKALVELLRTLGGDPAAVRPRQTASQPKRAETAQ